ncbi:MAG: hypothetical protein WCH44_05120 [Betaproteobacteria bacterium]
MKTNAFGQTGLQVSVLGFGTMHLNDERSEADAAWLLNQAHAEDGGARVGV